MSKTTKKKEKCIGLAKNGNPCNRNVVKDNLCSHHWELIYGNTLIKKSFDTLQNRYSDTKNLLTKLIYTVKHENKEPDSIDLEKKREIFGDLNKCFITGNTNIGDGDHFFEINGYYKKTGYKSKKTS